MMDDEPDGVQDGNAVLPLVVPVDGCHGPQHVGRPQTDHGGVLG